MSDSRPSIAGAGLVHHDGCTTAAFVAGVAAAEVAAADAGAEADGATGELSCAGCEDTLFGAVDPVDAQPHMTARTITGPHIKTD
jgi:hypothetical protein